MTVIVPTIVPTGGAITLSFVDPHTGATTVSGTCMLERAVSGVSGIGTWTPLYSGVPLYFFVDPGDMLPGPLQPNVTYVYRLTDLNGPVLTDGLTPGNTVAVIPDGMTNTLLRLIQGALNGLVPPPGIIVPQVTNAMPLGSFPPLPLIVVNQDLIQQKDVPIGQNVEAPNQENVWTIGGTARRMWRVSIMSRNTLERDYFRDAIVASFKVLLTYVFMPLGRNVRHHFQVNSGTASSEFEGLAPGFHFAEILLDVDGTYDTAVVTQYGQIATIRTTATEPRGEAADAVVPPDDPI